MLGGCKTERELRSKLERWRHLGDDKKIIHTVRSSYLKTSALGRQSAESVFNSWDVISCSLISLNKTRKILREGAQGLAPWEYTTSKTGLFFELGFILDVQPQNILGTHCHDVWFPNHAGTMNKNSWALADAIFSGRGISVGKHKWPAQNGHSYNRIETPEHILRFTDFSEGHNEILVIGKSNINTYPGYKPTDRIKISAIIVAQKNQTGHTFFCREMRNEMDEMLEILRRANPGTKVIDLSKN